MKHRNVIRGVCLFLLICIPLHSGGNQETYSTADKITIVTSILPHQYAVDRVGGSYVSTMALVGPGQSPHSYEPTVQQMAKLATADAWILSNTDFEIALKDKVADLYPHLLITDGTATVKFRTLEEHDHEESEPTAHGTEIDRHTWLGREPMKIFATHVYDTLVLLDPVQEPYYAANLATFHADIDMLFDTLAVELAPLRGTTVFVYHPSFGYFLDEFGIVQKAVETGGKEPSAKALSALIQEARSYGCPTIFVQAQFPVSAAQTIARAVGAEVIALDPLAYDWLENIRRMGDTLRNALSAREEE